MNKNVKAIDVAEWFVQRAIMDSGEGGEYLTQLKLQKLLYYAQGFFMALSDCVKLFDEKIEKLQYGPVVKDLKALLGKHGNNPITKSLGGNASVIDDKALTVLEFVYEKFGQFSASKLVTMTHNESPWMEAEFNKEISTESICKYFKHKYVH